MGIADREGKSRRKGVSLPLSDFRARKSPRNAGLSAASANVSEKRDCMLTTQPSANRSTGLDSLLTGKLTGNFVKTCPFGANPPCKEPGKPGDLGEFPSNWNREFFRGKSEKFSDLYLVTGNRQGGAPACPIPLDAHVYVAEA